MRVCVDCGQSLSGRSDRRFCARHSARVEIVVASSTKASWQAEAQREGMTLSEWLLGRVERQAVSLPTTTIDEEWPVPQEMRSADGRVEVTDPNYPIWREEIDDETHAG